MAGPAHRRYDRLVALLRYTLRRLLASLPTLLGISLVSFGLIQLAPGDAAGGAMGAGRPLSKREAEAQRRLFFLDLPLFYNSRPRGLEARLERICGDLASKVPARLRLGQASLRRCGTLCLRALVAKQAPCNALDAPRRRLLASQILSSHPALGGDLAQAARRIAPATLGELVAKLGAGDAVTQLVGRGSVALAPAMRALLTGDPQTKRTRAASAVAARLSGLSGQLRATDAPAVTASKLARWRAWWRQYRRDYVRFGSWERTHGRVTETQYGKWIGRLLRLDFGVSLHDGRPVTDKLAAALPVTLLLSGLSMLLAYLLAVPIGVHAAVKRGTRGERALTLGLFMLYSLPPFWVAMLLIMLLGGVGMLDLFPIHGLSSPGAAQLGDLAWFFDRVWHLVLPVFCLSYGSLAVLSRYQRGAMLEALSQDYIRAARAKGLSERRVVWRHALPNALLPTITLLGLQFPYLISGSVIIERIFNIPGMGHLTFDAFLQRDTPVIMAVVVLSAALTLLGLILADVLYAVVDPRIALRRQVPRIRPVAPTAAGSDAAGAAGEASS
jgi:peptide/nickel transport system permease protein